MTRARRWLLVLVVLCLGALAGCKADAAVTVDVQSGGSGTVTVDVVADKEATDRLDLRRSVVTDDLKQAGWKVTAPEEAPGGGVKLVASKPFANPDELRLVLDEVGGQNGIFKDIRLETDTRLFSETSKMTGQVDLSKGIESYGDEDIRKTAGGSAVGVDPKVIESEAKTPIGQVVNLKFVVNMPDELTATNAPTGVTGKSAAWTPAAGQVTPLEVTTSYTRTFRIVVLALVALVLLALAALLVRSRLRVVAARQRRARRGADAVPGGPRVAGNNRPGSSGGGVRRRSGPGSAGGLHGSGGTSRQGRPGAASDSAGEHWPTASGADDAAHRRPGPG